MAWYLGVGNKLSRGMKGTDKPPKTPIPEGKKIKKKTSDSLEKEIKRLDVAAQTPFEKARRRRRIWQSKKHS